MTPASSVYSSSAAHAVVWPVWLGGGFVLCAGAVTLLLPVLRRMQFRQHAYEDAPQSHQTKTGTPTMGGIAFVIAMLPLVLWDVSGPSVAIFLLVLLCAIVGFIDDYSAIRRGKNRGLSARTKYLLTALAAIIFLRLASTSSDSVDVIFRSWNYALTVPHWFWLLLGILAVSGTIHAVNLTDGLDGLASGTMIPPLLGLLALSYMGYTVASLSQHSLSAIFWTPAAVREAALLGAGACAGFLVFNRHPAKVFMGDTGSLALGALLSGIAILEGQMLLLILIGGVFVAEALSVIIQVTYFKRTGGKRIFKMSPLHHHFELSGWPETKVTALFWATSAMCTVVGVLVAGGLGLQSVR